MSRYVYVAHVGTASGNIPFAAAALCSSEYLKVVQEDLKRLDDELDICGAWDVWKLKQALVSALRTVAPKSVIAAAMTMQTWEQETISGGVIGYPRYMIRSGTNQVEQLARDVWRVAFPEGPDLLLVGERQLMDQAVQAITMARCLGEDPWPKLKKLLWDAEAYLYATDGSRANGFLAASGANGMCSIYMNEEMH